MTDHEFHTVADEFIGDRHAFLRVGAFVSDHDLNLLPENAPGRVDILGRLLGAVLELGAEGRAAAGDRAGHPQFDLRRSAGCESKAKTDGEAKREPLSHGIYLWMESQPVFAGA